MDQAPQCGCRRDLAVYGQLSGMHAIWPASKTPTLKSGVIYRGNTSTLCATIRIA